MIKTLGLWVLFLTIVILTIKPAILDYIYMPKVNRDTKVRIQLVGNESKTIEGVYLLRFDTGKNQYLKLKPKVERVLLNKLGVNTTPNLKVIHSASVNLANHEEKQGNQTTTSEVYEINPNLIVTAKSTTENFKEDVVVRFPVALAISQKLQASSPSTIPEVRFQVTHYSTYSELWFTQIISSAGIASLIVGLCYLPSLFKYVQKYLEIREKFKKAIKKYVNSGGRDPTVLEILKYLRKVQKRELYVEFNLKNELDPNDLIFDGDNGNRLTLFSSYQSFVADNLDYLENIIINQLNYSFSQIISNDVFYFIKSKIANRKHVFFEIGYVVKHTDAIYTKQGLAEVTQGFRGIMVMWNIKIFINQKLVRNIQFSSLPAENFSVIHDATHSVSNKEIFDKMAETAFIDLNHRLQEELQI